METDPSRVPQVCKFGCYVILTSGCLFVRSVTHLTCFCNLLVLGLFCFLYFHSFVWKSILLLKVRTFVTPVALCSSFYRRHGRRCEVISIYGLLAVSQLSKSPVGKNTTFRKCSDNPQIPSSWITVFYSSWHEARGVKSQTATRGLGEGKRAFICFPLQVKLFQALISQR